MTSTEYLFGKPKEHYHGMKFPELGYERVKDAKEVKYKLYDRITYDPKDKSKFQVWLRVRIRKIDDAINVWQKILEVEEG